VAIWLYVAQGTFLPLA